MESMVAQRVAVRCIVWLGLFAKRVPNEDRRTPQNDVADEVNPARYLSVMLNDDGHDEKSCDRQSDVQEVGNGPQVRR